jgi:hypothetical protein
LEGPLTKRKRYLGLFLLCLIGGVLTKSIAGLYFAPGLLLFTIAMGRLVQTLRQNFFWLSVLGFLIIIGGYYTIAEYYYPGYLQLVWENELLPRFFNNSELYHYNQMPEPFHYTKILVTENFKHFFYFLPFGLLLVYFKNSPKESRFALATLITALTFHVVISNGTYNAWYNAPIFPLLAIITGLGLNIIFQALKVYLKLNDWRFYVFAGAFVLTCFAVPYNNILKEKVYFIDDTAGYEHYGAYLNYLRKYQPTIKKITLYSEVSNDHVLFYWTVYNKCYDYQISNCGTGNNVATCPDHSKARPGDHVMVCSDNIKTAVKKHFETKTVGRYKNCELYLVEHLKTAPIKEENQ